MIKFDYIPANMTFNNFNSRYKLKINSPVHRIMKFPKSQKGNFI